MALRKELRERKRIAEESRFSPTTCDHFARCHKQPSKKSQERAQQRFTLQPACHKVLPSPGLTRNNVSKIAKLVLDAINDDIDDTDQDAGEIETPTAEETEDESVTQEVQNSIGMYRIIKRVIKLVC